MNVKKKIELVILTATIIFIAIIIILDPIINAQYYENKKIEQKNNTEIIFENVTTKQCYEKQTPLYEQFNLTKINNKYQITLDANHLNINITTNAYQSESSIFVEQNKNKQIVILPIQIQNIENQIKKKITIDNEDIAKNYNCIEIKQPLKIILAKKQENNYVCKNKLNENEVLKIDTKQKCINKINNKIEESTLKITEVCEKNEINLKNIYTINTIEEKDKLLNELNNSITMQELMNIPIITIKNENDIIINNCESKIIIYDKYYECELDDFDLMTFETEKNINSLMKLENKNEFIIQIFDYFDNNFKKVQLNENTIENIKKTLKDNKIATNNKIKTEISLTSLFYEYNKNNIKTEQDIIYIITNNNLQTFQNIEEICQIINNITIITNKNNQTTICKKTLEDLSSYIEKKTIIYFKTIQTTNPKIIINNIEYILKNNNINDYFLDSNNLIIEFEMSKNNTENEFQEITIKGIANKICPK